MLYGFPMKLRVRDNSIRLRLTRGEVDDIAGKGLVRGSVPFSGGVSFDYVLESSRACVDAMAQFSSNVLTVSIPQVLSTRTA